MQLARFLNQVFKKDGFILTDANLKDYIIGNPGDNPIKLKILNKTDEEDLINALKDLKFTNKPSIAA